MASLVERHGGVAVRAPSLREVAAEAEDAEMPASVRAFAEALFSGSVDVLVFFTGVGARGLFELLCKGYARERVVSALQRVCLVVRGPKPARALRELGVSGCLTCAEPSTSSELVALLERSGTLIGKRIFVQAYGSPNASFDEALRSRGATVVPLFLYKYALPLDTAPLRSALARIASGEISIVLFTSRAQVEHALVVASEEGLEEALRKALGRCFVGSIGPVCSEALRQEGIEPDMEPSLSRMGQLVKEASERADEVLLRKAGRAHHS